MTKVPVVRDIMVEAPFSFPPDMPAYDAVDKLIAKDVPGVPVIDESKALVGFLTEKDCLRLLAIAHQYNMTGRTVGDIMSQIKESLHPQMDLLSAAMRFLNCNFSTLPVMEEEQLVGSITRHAMLKTIQQFHSTNGHGIEVSKRNQRLMQNPLSIEELQIVVMQSDNAQLASVLRGRYKD